MTYRRFFRAAAMLPLVGLGVAAWLTKGVPADLPAEWDWIYPGSIARGLVVYALVATWLWVEIGRRPPSRITGLLWLAPVVYLGLSWLLMLGLALARGRAAELWAEHSSLILMRAAIHLTIGFTYVALTHVAFRALREGGGVAGIPGSGVSR